MNEQSFARACTPSLLAWYPHALAFRELETSTGVPDLLFVGRKGATAELSPLLKTLTNGRAVVAASLSPSRPHTLAYLCCRTGLEEQAIRRALAELRAAGVAECTPTGSWQLVQSVDLSGLRLEVVEFKLRDWRKALAQACRYRSLADRVTVVMPAASGRSAEKRAAMFRMYGIGLATFCTRSGELLYLSRPRISGPLSVASRLDAIGRAASIGVV